MYSFGLRGRFGVYGVLNEDGDGSVEREVGGNLTFSAFCDLSVESDASEQVRCHLASVDVCVCVLCCFDAAIVRSSSEQQQQQLPANQLVTGRCSRPQLSPTHTLDSGFSLFLSDLLGKAKKGGFCVLAERVQYECGPSA